MPSIREKAAQLLFVRIGSNMPPPVRVEDDVDRVKSLLDRCPLGGLILFNGNYRTTPSILETLQTRSSEGLLVSADLERGAGQQLAGATVFPHAMAFSQLEYEAESYVREAARVTAQEARDAGLHIIFAPVADVNRDPRNPIISTRSYGNEPDLVARLVRAHIEGIHAGGLLATAKHFPGHGNTRDDSHAMLPVVPSSRADLESFDLVPFSAAIQAGVDLVMTAHVWYPALDALETPATVSRSILKTLLRDEMRFEGAVITDSLLMGAIQRRYTDPGKLAVALIDAGVDILLDAQHPEAMIDGIERAVDSGALAEERLDEAYLWAKNLRTRLLTGVHRSVSPDPATGNTEHSDLVQSVALRSTRVFKECSDLELRGIRPGELLSVFVKPFSSHLDPSEAPLKRFLNDRFGEVEFIEIGPEPEASIVDGLWRQARDKKAVLVSMIARPAAWRTFGLPAQQARLIQDLTVRHRVILASLGSPYVLDDYPKACMQICTFSDVAASQWALAQYLAGRLL